MYPRRAEPRSLERLRAHYEVERQLADRLRTVGREERARLYGTVYDELFRRVPDHPQVSRKADPEARLAAMLSRLRMLDAYVTPDCTFMEVGPGDCSLAMEMASRVKQVYAVDVSAEITKDLAFPSNSELILCSGSEIPLPPATVDVAYSYQLLEHLHPDDAIEHVRMVRTILRPGGVYICVTPNRLSGPHDISKFFDEVATGFHLREYTATELSQLFRREGFRKVSVVTSARGRSFSLPYSFLRSLERFLEVSPRSAAAVLARSRLIEPLLGNAVVAST